jgi:hypothetical protein
MRGIIFKTIGFILVFLVLLQVAIAVFNNVNPWLGIIMGIVSILLLAYILIITFIPKNKE